MPRASKAVDAAKQLGQKAAAAGAATSTPKAAAQKKPAKAKSTEAKPGKAGKADKAQASAKKAPGAVKAPAGKKVPEAEEQHETKAAKPGKSAKKLEGAGVDKFLEEQQVLLNEERISYLAQAADLKAEADQLAQEMEPGDIQFDDESGEGATAAVDRERDLALSAQARVEVDEIDHALAKLAGGSYGICESCGQPIPRARLKALPHARLCVACKSGGLSRR